VCRAVGLGLVALPCYGHLSGKGPPEPHQLTGHGHHDWLGRLPPGHEAARALAQPELRLPAEILDGCGVSGQSPLEMATDLRRITVRPGACHQRPAGMGVPGCGDGTRSASRAGGRCRGEQTPAFQPCSRSVQARAVTAFSAGRDGHDPLHATPGLEGLAPRVEAPGLNRRVEFLCQALEACGEFGDRAAICLPDAWLSRGVTDPCTPPPQGRRAPSGAACRADSGSESERVAPERGRCESAQGLCTRAGAIADGVICSPGDLDRGEIPRAHHPGQWHGITAIGVDAVTRLVGHAGGRDDPAVITFVGQVAVEPVAAGSGFRDQDEGWGLGWPCADEVSAVAVAGADGTKRAAVGVVSVGDRGHRDRIVVDIQTDRECASVCQG
jgi:hypothetical protein